jgi:hypothetical protein
LFNSAATWSHVAAGRMRCTIGSQVSA